MDQITTKAVEAYQSASDEGKEALEAVFGKEVFRDAISTLKTFDDVLKATGTAKKQFDASCSGLRKDEVAYRKATLIVQALNQGWEPDWTDENEYKWCPWMEFKSGRKSGFSLRGVGCSGRTSRVPSRLCFRSRELAEYAVSQFADVYSDMFNHK